MVMATEYSEQSMQSLRKENAMLREEVRVSRQASDITAQLVVEQFTKIEDILQRLEDKARTERQLGEALADKLRESEDREHELAQDRARLQEMQVVAINMMEDIAAARESAEAATRVKSEFLANMSHEIRTPMSAILGYIDLMAEGCPRQCRFARTERAAHLATITRNADHLLEIINGILDLSKIEADRLEVEGLRCTPQALLADVYALMKVRADQAGLSLEVSTDGRLPETIITDPTRLKQILINLVGNAIKFTKRGGVRVVARYPARPPQQAGGPRDDLLQFDVVDTGIGVKPENLGAIFEPFSQADSSTTREHGGTGLGLAISKRLARLLGGDLSAGSSPGRGSTFSLTIATRIAGTHLAGPATAVPEPAPPDPQPTPPASDRLACRVLLAEDGPDNRRLIETLLKQAGAEVFAVEDGQQAVQAVQAAASEHRPYDVVLMDMQMPVLDGYGATRELRSRGYRGPIIALTAHAMTDDRRKCLEAGCDDYAAKPITRARLIELVQRYSVRTGKDGGK